MRSYIDLSNQQTLLCNTNHSPTPIPENTVVSERTHFDVQRCSPGSSGYIVNEEVEGGCAGDVTERFFREN
jgi:hypothetical protein